MSQLLFYNMKILIMILLISVLVVEHMVDYRALLSEPTGIREQPAIKSINLIGKYIEQYGFSKYRNVIDDNIFAVNVIIEDLPVEKKAKPISKPFTMQLAITGIAITPERKMVMVWDKSKNESQVLLQGESLYQWEVISIDKKKVVLKNEAGDRYEFELNDESLKNSKI